MQGLMGTIAVESLPKQDGSIAFIASQCNDVTGYFHDDGLDKTVIYVDGLLNTCHITFKHVFFVAIGFPDVIKFIPGVKSEGQLEYRVVPIEAPDAGGKNPAHQTGPRMSLHNFINFVLSQSKDKGVVH